MGVSSTNYGSFKTHEGTLAECAGAVKGEPAIKLTWLYDAGNSKFVCIEG